jgi:hypothetical protein
MKISTYYLLDKFAIGLLTPIIILLKLKNIFFRLFKKSQKLKFLNKNENLLIKFAGAGNFFALKKIIIDKNFEIVTTSDNKEAINQINKKINCHYININNIFLFFYSTLYLVFKLFLKKYKNIIVLETSSSLGMLLSLLPFSEKISSVSTKYKSILEFCIYDFILITPSNVDRKRVIQLLINFKPKSTDNSILFTKKYQNLFILNHSKKLNVINEVLIAPGCAPHDNLRRLKNGTWIKILKLLNKKKITIIFSSISDEQYNFFNRQKFFYDNLDIKITTYQELINYIKSTHLLIAIDSQALRIANSFNKISISFYGVGGFDIIDLNLNTYPIYLGLECSPCFGKYYRRPCNNAAPCRNFSKKDLQIFDRI